MKLFRYLKDFITENFDTQDYLNMIAITILTGVLSLMYHNVI